MPFPMPKDPAFRREVVEMWLDDIEDRLGQGLLRAQESWRMANDIYLSLPPGEGSGELEEKLVRARVKLNDLMYTNNENHLQRRTNANSGETQTQTE